MSYAPAPSRLSVVAGAVLALVTACDEPVLLVVEVGLNYGTCNTGDPRDIILSCPSTAGAWVRDDEGNLLDEECVSVGDATGQALDDLHDVFTEMDLRADSGTRVNVEVALFASQPGGCVPPAELAPEDRPEVILAGTARSAKLTGSRGPVEIFAQCPETPARSTAEECQLACGSIQDECLGGVATGACQRERDDCVAGCDDAACRESCAVPYETCLAGSVDGSCRLAFERCVETGERPDDDCNRDQYECVVDGCEDQHDECFAACPSPGCALFPIP